MIILNQVHKQYASPAGTVTALDNINLHVKAGEIFGIIGKSGAGKSTLVRCVNLLEKPDQGHIIVANQNLLKLPAAKLRIARRKMGMIFQQFNLLSSRHVYDNIALPLELSGHSRQDIKRLVTPLLELTGLTDKTHSFPAQLSGGQKQRVAIARALACQPHVLLSDEATSALDPETTLSILALLKNIRDTLNVTILLITHEMSVIKACCDRVALMQNGKFIEENEVGEFFTHPKTEIAKNFIAASVLQQLPAFLEEHVLPDARPDTYPILRLWFLEDSAARPIVSDISHLFQLRVSILQANIEYIKNHAMGLMLIVLHGHAEKIKESMAYLRKLGINVEIIGHVPNSIVPLNQ